MYGTNDTSHEKCLPLVKACKTSNVCEKYKQHEVYNIPMEICNANVEFRTKIRQWLKEDPEERPALDDNFFLKIQFVTDMSELFKGADDFNQPITFNTSNVTNMSCMFMYAANFNQPLTSFDTSNVTNMSQMFYNAVVFNQPLDSFNTSNVTNMNGMFMYAFKFNQPLTSFDFSNVEYMRDIFVGSSRNN